MSQQRQIKRLEKAIDELLKIQDDGEGNDAIARLLEQLNYEIAVRQCEEN